MLKISKFYPIISHLMPLMNAEPLLGEIKQALKELYEKGEKYIIYSNKLPTTLDDRYYLQEVLGKGNLFMYEVVRHTKTVSFNTLIPGVWINVFFSDINPTEPILEMVEVNFFPEVFSIPKEDGEEALKRFKDDVDQMRDYLNPFAFEVLEKFEKSLKEGKDFILENPEGIENLTYYLLTSAELVIEDKTNPDKKIVSTNYPYLWLEYEKETPVRLYIGNFPLPLKVKREQLPESVKILENRARELLSKYKNKVDLPLL